MKEKVSSKQVFTVLFLSSILFIASLSSESLNYNLWDSVCSVLIAFAFNVILSIPIFLLRKNNKNLLSQLKRNKFFAVFALLYIFYFLVSDIVTLSSMQNLFLNTLYPDVSPIILALLILATAFYGAYKGIEAVARSGFIVLLFFVIGIILTLLGLIDIIEFTNREQFFYEGYNDLFSNAAVVFSRCSIIPQLAIFSYCIKGEMKLWKFSLTQLFASLIVVFIIFITVFCLGRFSQTQIYPFYTLFTVSRLAPFERLDAIFSIIWLMVLTFKLSLNILIVKLISSKSNKNNVLVLLVYCVLVLIGSVFLVENYILTLSIIQLISIIFSVILGSLLPLFYCVKGKIK